jgi:GMP synthase-like glutamine amidotransferase
VDNHNASSRAKKLANFLSPHQIDVVNVQDLQQGSYDSHGLVVLSGGNVQIASSEDGTFDEEIDLLTRVVVPVFGVCLGMQIIARSFGAKIEDLKNPTQGVVQVAPFGDHPLVKDTPIFPAYQNHRRVVAQIPPTLEVLGYSEDGIEIIKHREKPIVGVQFHPERDRDSLTQGRIIFDRFMEQMVYES